MTNDMIPIMALDRPIAFHRAFRRVTGSTVAAVLLSQLWYWHQRVPDTRGGWFYKAMAELYDETGMSRREVETARAKLRSIGVISEERRGTDPTVWFRVNVAELARLISAEYAIKPHEMPDGGNVHQLMHETHITDGGNVHHVMHETDITSYSRDYIQRLPIDHHGARAKQNQVHLKTEAEAQYALVMEIASGRYTSESAQWDDFDAEGGTRSAATALLAIGGWDAIRKTDRPDRTARDFHFAYLRAAGADSKAS